MYHYFAATCYIELYRNPEASTEDKEKHAEKAEELITKIPSFVGRRFMAQQMPLEVFILKKCNRWQARMKERGVRLVDAIGVSPYEEMIYLWNGFKRMHTANCEASLRALQYSEGSENDTLDEQAIRNVVLSVVHRNIGGSENLAKAKELLQKVLAMDKASLAGKENWIGPSSHYEMAVVLWTESGPQEKEEIKQWLTKAAGFGAYELDARLGIRVQTAMGTIENC